MRSCFILAAAMFLAAPALAKDRPASMEELATIEAVLQTAGFTHWDDIEWDDDGHWEVDDAVGSDGRQYDLKLDVKFEILSRNPD